MKTLRKAAIATLAITMLAATVPTAAMAGKGGGKGGHGNDKGDHMNALLKKDCRIHTVRYFVQGQGWVYTQREFCN